MLLVVNPDESVSIGVHTPQVIEIPESLPTYDVVSVSRFYTSLSFCVCLVGCLQGILLYLPKIALLIVVLKHPEYVKHLCVYTFLIFIIIVCYLTYDQARSMYNMMLLCHALFNAGETSIWYSNNLRIQRL